MCRPPVILGLDPHFRALLFILIAAERLVVGSLLATEALLANLLLRSAAVVSI